MHNSNQYQMKDVIDPKKPRPIPETPGSFPVKKTPQNVPGKKEKQGQ